MIIGGTWVRELGDSFAWTGGLEVDVDGAPTAYAPPGSSLEPLDVLANAGHVGNWWGLACNDYGIPYVQAAGDPAPGYYVSTTSLVDHSRSARDPLRYVDASEVPYLAVPPELLKAGASLGSLAMVVRGDVLSAAIVADVGPRGKIGEGSFALHRALGLDPRRAIPAHRLVGTESGISCVIFAGSAKAPAWPRSIDELSSVAAGYFMGWGGVDRLLATVAGDKT